MKTINAYGTPVDHSHYRDKGAGRAAARNRRKQREVRRILAAQMMRRAA